MKPHIVPRVVLNKKDMTYRDRGVNHNTFTAASNYYGNGKQGTLERQLANMDEASMNTVIQSIRSGVNYNWQKRIFIFFSGIIL